MSDYDGTLQTRFRVVGVPILVAGLLVAALIERRATREEASSDATMPGNTKRYKYDMERIGGKSNLVAAEFREWFGSLWHGKRLAHTVAVLSIGGGLACFVIAYLLDIPAPPDAPPNVEKR